MKRIITTAAIAGLACGALAQGVTLHFGADVPAIAPGGTVHWVVSASFTGYGPTAYFGGFSGPSGGRGKWPASDPLLGDAVNLISLMAGNATTPVANGASVENIDMFHSALLGTDDPSNPIDIFEFDVDITAQAGVLSYDAIGVASQFADSFIFRLPDEYWNDENRREIGIDTDFVVIDPDALPAPEVTVTLAADRTEVNSGETVIWTLSAAFTGWSEPGAYTGWFEGDLLAIDPDLGLAGNVVSLVGGDASGTPDGASLLGLAAGQPAGGPFDTANPIALCTFEVQTTTPGTLAYDLAGRVGVYRPTLDQPYIVHDLIVITDTVDVLSPGCNPADLAEPYGTLDAADITAFVDRFVAQGWEADLAEPMGTWDLADVVAYVEAFMAGCP
jgi:hypothetical protein